MPLIGTVFGWEVAIDPIYGCWLWGGRVDHTGYGRVWYHGRDRVAHWVVYELMRGVKPGNKVQLDHFCRRRSCCNPRHLDPVSQSENIRRVHARHRRAVAKCPEGHLLTSDSYLTTPEGGRACRPCLELHPTSGTFSIEGSE